MKNENLKNVKTTENEVVENIGKVLEMPYTNETMIKEVKSCLKPLLENKGLAKKWSHDICYFGEISATELIDDREIVEDNILRKVNPKSYINAFNKIKNSSMMLIGKAILIGNKDVSQLEKYIIRIRGYIDYMYCLDYSVTSWLYDRADEYNSSSYIPLADTVNHAYTNFSTNVYQNYRSMKFEKLEFRDLDSNSKNKIQILSIIYDSLMNLAVEVLELGEESKLKNQLGDFIRNMTRVLSYLAGQIYMQVDDDKFIYSNTKKSIDKVICKLEENSTLKYNLENSDKSYIKPSSLENAYQNVKRNINSLISLLK